MGARRHAFCLYKFVVQCFNSSRLRSFEHLTYNVHLHTACACSYTALAAGAIWLCSSPDNTELHVPEVNAGL